MNNIDFGKMIQKLRKKSQITQKDLAEKLNISDKTVSKWENGWGYPEITILAKLSEAFEVSVDYLLKGNPRGIVLLGKISTDIVYTLDKYPERSSITKVATKYKSIGGCATNIAVNLSIIDPDLFLTVFGRVGNDENGRFILTQLKKNGLDTTGILVSEHSVTGVSHVMAEEKTGVCTFFVDEGANDELSMDDVDVEGLEGEIFYMGYAGMIPKLNETDELYGTKMSRLLHDVSERGIKTCIDIDSVDFDNQSSFENLLQALKYCDYVLLDEDEACMISGLSARDEDGTLNVPNIKKSMNILIGYGIREKVIVHSVEAGFILTANGSFTMVPSLVLPDNYIKSAVGVGDAFAAGCLYGIYKNYGDAQILEFASGVAAASLSALDAVGGMVSKGKIEKNYLSLTRREIKL